jgi:hypothetical protein
MKQMDNKYVLEHSLKDILEKMTSVITEEIKKSSDKSPLIEKKKEIQRLIRLMVWAQKNGIRSEEKVVTLPDNIVASPSSNYRIVDDCETDDKTRWLELTLDNEKLLLNPGDKIIFSTT